MKINEKEQYRIKTRSGYFELEASSKGLCGVRLLSHSPRKVTSKKKVSPVLKKAERLLTDYFDGKAVSFEALPIDYSSFTRLEKKVLRELLRIPRGSVRTYGGLAKKVGTPRASRFVGSVMRKNRMPLVLPCHRVVRSDGVLGQYSLGGSGWKKKLLKLEGVVLAGRRLAR